MAKPTIHDVARLAGVSIKTVSRVTNSDGQVASETADRVRQAIEELGYLASPIARSLRTGRDDAVGLVVESIGDPFFASVTEAVEEAAREAGLFLLIASAGQTPDQERAVVRGLLDRSVRGLIIVPCHLAYGAEGFLTRPESVPVVFVDRPADDLEADVVMIDNAATARAATEHLIAHGHRRIAFVGTELDHYPVNARIDGYRQALADHGEPYDPSLVISYHRPAIKDDLLRRGPLAAADPATAVLCGNLLSSLSVVGELHRIRRTDVAMVSIDDFPVADALDPAITVAGQHPELMGRRAFELLLDRIAGVTAPPRRIVLPTNFIARGSGELRPQLPALTTAAATRRGVDQYRTRRKPPVTDTHTSPGTRAGLASIAGENGTLAIVAMDQRNTLRRMLTAVSRPTDPDELRAFKVDVVAALSPGANALLLDPEFGVPAVREAGVMAPGCATLVAVEPAERDTWEGEPRARRDPERSAAWVRDQGGDAVKLLVQMRPDRPRQAGEPDLVAEVVDVVQAVVDDCAAAGVPSVIETLLYRLPGEDPLPDRQRADLIVESARILTQTRPDLLKLEYPVDARGCAAVADVITVPWAMLSAGMPFPAFLEAVTTSCDHGGASGFIAGRVYWQEAVAMAGTARKDFLASAGRRRLDESVAAMSGRAQPWYRAGQQTP
jgi:DNA-binding LacI/PurR family transcriptional regulator/tagatose-1,6-bisphosphate aldolase